MPVPTTEKQIQTAVMAHWRSLGVQGSLVAAIPNEAAFRQPGLTKGLPDLLVISPARGGFVGFIELKKDGGKLRPEQAAVIDLIRKSGAPVAVTYGRDEPVRLLEEWGVIRASARSGANPPATKNTPASSAVPRES